MLRTPARRRKALSSLSERRRALRKRDHMKILHRSKVFLQEASSEAL
ncbi:hypothetical protein [Ferrimonas sp.]